MALLNPITTPWKPGLALLSGLCGAAAATWGPVPFCPQGQCPEGQASLQCPEAPSIPRDAWRLRVLGAGVCIQHSQRCYTCEPGLSSYMCNLHSPVGVLQHAMCLPISGCACSWHSGSHTCVLVSFMPGPALTGHTSHL